MTAANRIGTAGRTGGGIRGQGAIVTSASPAQPVRVAASRGLRDRLSAVEWSRVVDVASIHYRGDRFKFAVTFGTE